MWKGVSVFQLLKTKSLSHHIAQWEGVADGRGRQSPSGCVFSGFCEPSRFSAKRRQIGPQAVHELRSLLRDMQLKFDTQLRRDI